MSERLPRTFSSKRWLTIWCVALGLYLTITLAAELAWRALGYRPSVIDSPALWRFWYENGARGGQRSIVLIGASRIQAGLSVSQMHRRLPGYRISQLGEYGGDSAVGLLRELALDERFRGLVVCDLLEPFIRRDRWDSQRHLYMSKIDIRTQFEAYTSAIVNDALALRNEKSGIACCLKELVNRGRMVGPSEVRMRADRSIELDFSQVHDLVERRDRKTAGYRTSYVAAEHPTTEGLMDELQEIDGFVRQIQARGGQVVFVRFPSTGGRFALEEEFHPKAAYWSSFAKSGSANFIHFQDLKGASALRCPDDSHLNYADAVRFTDILMDELIARRLVTASN